MAEVDVVLGYFPIGEPPDLRDYVLILGLDDKYRGGRPRRWVLALRRHRRPSRVGSVNPPLSR